MSEELKEIGGGDIGGDAGEGVYDVDSIADMFSGTDEADEGGENQPLDDSDEAETSEGAQDSQEPDEGEQDVPPDIPMPEGFEEAMWQDSRLKSAMPCTRGKKLMSRPW